MKRPVSLTILAWLLIVASLRSLIALCWSFGQHDVLMELYLPQSHGMLSWLPACWSIICAVLQITIGIAILWRRAWSRIVCVPLVLIGVIWWGVYLHAMMKAGAPGIVVTWVFVKFAEFLWEWGVYAYLLHRRPATQYFGWKKQIVLNTVADMDAHDASPAADTSEVGDSTQKSGVRWSLGAIRARNVLAITLFVLSGGFLCAAQGIGAIGLFSWILGNGLDGPGDWGGVAFVMVIAYSYMRIFAIAGILFLVGGAFIGAFRPRTLAVGVTLLTTAVVSIPSTLSTLDWVLPTSASLLTKSAASDAFPWLGISVIPPVLCALVGVWLARRRPTAPNAQP